MHRKQQKRSLFSELVDINIQIANDCLMVTRNTTTTLYPDSIMDKLQGVAPEWELWAATSIIQDALEMTTHHWWSRIPVFDLRNNIIGYALWSRDPCFSIRYNNPTLCGFLRQKYTLRDMRMDLTTYGIPSEEIPYHIRRYGGLTRTTIPRKYQWRVIKHKESRVGSGQPIREVR